MKIINKQNFFPTVCVVYTLLVLGKLVLEYIVQGLWENYQGNLLVMFVLSLLAVFVLSQYYRFQKYPLLAVIVVQYLVLIGGVMLFTWIVGLFEPLHENGYRDMFLSFSIPYAIGVVVYYAALFHEVKAVNRVLRQIKDEMPEEQG
ncbi:MAG: hypothetical protein HDR28_02770 [Lachnospiraceae bacterium]|nr:hypothetical protein [Lachnospiraceae bacterium]